MQESSRLVRELRLWCEVHRPPQPWAVGFSGGKDSVVLLWCLRILAPETTALYVDHGWRSMAERDAERQYVEALATEWGFPLSIFGPPRERPRSENQARDHRYRQFENWQTQSKGSIFLAHHRQDQAETILLRLLQGRFGPSVEGIPEVRPPFYRPFLRVSPQILTKVLEEASLPFFHDSTNDDDGPQRNYLRNQVFPVLNKRFPNIEQTLVTWGELWASERERMTPSSLVESALGENSLIPIEIWDSWSPLRRGDELRRRSGPEVPLSKRFLTKVCEDVAILSQICSGWVWRRNSRYISWERVVPSDQKAYLIPVQVGHRVETKEWSMLWTQEATGESQQVPSVDPQQPWMCRTIFEGTPLTTTAGTPWTASDRKIRLGGEVLAVVQSGFVVATLDLQKLKVRWVCPEQAKLHNGMIFVKLERRSTYER